MSDRLATPVAPGIARRLAAPIASGVVVATGAALILLADPTTPGGPIPVCPTKAVLDVTCPGCGSCRMVYSLLHGDLPAALHYNALGVIALVLLAATWLRWSSDRARDAPRLSWTTRRWAPAAVLAITFAWSALRNIPVDPFLTLRV